VAAAVAGERAIFRCAQSKMRKLVSTGDLAAQQRTVRRIRIENDAELHELYEILEELGRGT
jgi:hypothetical protein